MRIAAVVLLALVACHNVEVKEDTGERVIDQDGDGWPEETDCDDLNPDVHPERAEVCDGVDNDCDGITDEDDPSLEVLDVYLDADEDGFGDPATLRQGCPQDGEVLDGTDCDDADPAVNPAAAEICNGWDDNCDGLADDEDPHLDDGATVAPDADGDGFGDRDAAHRACMPGKDEVEVLGDCDDADAAVHPDATEICDGLDNDCDDTTDEPDAADAPTWYADADGDGFGDAAAPTVACAQPSDHVADATDCDDARADVFPEAAEWCNGVDDDCDGTTDEDDAADAHTWYLDADGDGFGAPGTSTSACAQPDGWVADATDCDDARAGSHPGATEYCNGTDDDCDGTTDEEGALDPPTWYRDFDSDGYGDATYTLVSCTAPSGYAATGDDCDDGLPTVNPGASEYCNGLDDDCDGTTDEATAVDATAWYPDSDRDGYGRTGGTPVTACYAPSGYGTGSSDCNDLDADIHPGATEICDGVDNDCNGTTDGTGLATFVSSSGTVTSYTSTLAAGTATSPVTVTLATSGTLSLCAGTYYARLSVSASSLVVDGVAGAASTTVNAGSSSSAVRVTSAARSLEITDLTLAGGNPTQGGGVYGGTHGLDLTLRRSVFSSNDADYGAGIYQSGGTVLLDNVDFGDGAADYQGGAFYIQDADVTLDTVTVDHCAAGIDGGGGFLLNCTTSVTDSAFDACTAGDDGGALYVSGGSATFTSSSFADGSADYGGGIAALEATLTFSDSDVQDNSATYFGGGIHALTTDVVLTSSRVHGNDSPGYWWDYGRAGGVLLDDDSSLTCTGSTATTAGIYDNTADYGGGAYIYDSGSTLSSSVCDWGSGSTDNSVYDVWLRPEQDGYSSWGDDASFSCTGSVCR